jgi:hypothetical protein
LKVWWQTPLELAVVLLRVVAVAVEEELVAAADEVVVEAAVLDVVDVAEAEAMLELHSRMPQSVKM